MSFFTREQCLERLRRQIATGKPIIGGGAGTGISAKCAEAGGIDLIIIYNSGRFRMAGRGSLSGMMPYGDANQIVMDMAREVLPIVRDTPVLAGVCGTDPFRVMKHFLRDVQAAGFSGVQNFPTVGLYDGTFRQNLEETGMGYGLDFDNERKMLRVARRIGDALGIRVRTTYLGAHALPPEFAGRADDYIDAVCRWLPALHAEGLVDAVDAFCERIGFTAAQTQRVFEAARALGIPVKLHADQLSDGGGAALVAGFAGLSADHLEM